MRVDTPADYRDGIAAALAGGERARDLHAGPGGRSVRVLLEDAHGRSRLVSTDVDADGAVASIADLAPALHWDEREAHDLYGITFPGHHPLRPLVDHRAAVEDWTVPVRGEDPYQIAVGPMLPAGRLFTSSIKRRMLLYSYWTCET